MSDPEEIFTIVDVVKVLHDKELRTKLINRCNHKSIKSFWEVAISAFSDAKLENVIPYISSKLNFFSDNHYVKRVVSNKKSTINFQEILNNNKIFLVNLSKGKLGSNNTVFFGRLLFNKLVTAAYSRKNTPNNKESILQF
ncbi:MAG: hypothetical protein IPG78_03510 [Ignavibacteria bacterium]|nr:hypothetical protein [Ignavibacteria bacterium]